MPTAAATGLSTYRNLHARTYPVAAGRNSVIGTPTAHHADVLPTLDTGPHLLDAPAEMRGAVHAIVCDTLLTTEGSVWWVDAGGRADAAQLAGLAPSRRALDRVRVARGFTAYQHHTVARRLGDAVADHVREGGSAPSLVVCPAVDDRYRADGVP